MKIHRFHLARELGMTVGELQKRMSHREFTEWVFGYFPVTNELRQQEQIDNG